MDRRFHLFGAYVCSMNIIGSIILGYMTLGLLVGSMNCLFRTRLYRIHPSSRLVTPDNAACDFLFTCLFLWPFLTGRDLYTKLKCGLWKG